MAEKCFCYCIGGTGARIAEVAAHLCTMNMLNDKNITFIVVDKDEECGGTKRAKKVIDYTEVISKIEGSDSKSGRLCRSRLSSKEDGNPTRAPWNFTKAIANIQGNANGNASLKVALGGNNSDNEILFDAFYSKSEQNSPTSAGFYGHPSIGALMFKYMMKNTNDDIAEPVLRYLNNHTGDVVKVFIIGSVFGGTGASVFSNLAAHIRDKSSGMNNIDNRLLISGVLLLPYFSFGASTNGNPRINDMEFFAKSRTALEQYSMDPNFMRNLDAGDNYNGNFDTLYICGQNPLHKVGEYSEGGSTQKNHFDLVDLIAAYAMVDFFKKDFMQAGNNGGIDNTKIGKIYEYRLHSGNNLNEVLDAQLSGNLAENLSKMLLFAAFVITKVYAPFKIKINIKEIRLVELTYGSELGILKNRNDVAKKIADIEAVTTGANPNGKNAGGIDVLYQYCVEYVKFVYDIAYNGKDWSRGADDYSGEYKLLNKDYIEKLYAICGAIKNNTKGNDLADFIESQNILDFEIVGGKTVNMVEDRVQGQLRNKLRVYKDNGTGAIDRFGDYVKAAFEECFN